MTKVKIATEKEAQKVFEEKYDRVVKGPPRGSSLIAEKEGAVVIFDSHGIVVPDTRIARCGCGRKVKLYLAQQIPPIWVGRCGRCRGLHVRGERTTVENMTEAQKRAWWKKAKETRKHRAFKP